MRQLRRWEETGEVTLTIAKPAEIEGIVAKGDFDLIHVSQILYNSLTEVFTVKGGDTNRTAANPTGRVRAMLTPIPDAPAANVPAPVPTDPAKLRPSSKITEPRK